MPLLAGGTVRLVPRERVMEPERLPAEIADAAVLQTVPALMRQVLDAVKVPGAPPLRRVRRVLAGGEAVPPELLAELRDAFPGAEVHVLYGPTEATVLASSHRVATDGTVAGYPIGAPLPGARLYVCDEALAPVPEGAPGELCIGGTGVARGYLGRPELTAAVFVPDPWAGEAGARMYRTGDRVRRLPDGTLEFLGRMDDQVKVRGHRVEPGEVAEALGAHPRLAQAAVVARESAAQGRHLVAYVVARRGEPIPTAGELRDFLSRTLPEYMIPSAFVALDALPLTPNGKVDRAALPAPPAVRPALSAPYVAPRTEAERQVAAVWEEVLGITGIGAEDGFAELGGHSLAATQAVARFRHALGVEVPLATVLGGGTVAEVARVLEAARSEGSAPGTPPLHPVPRDGDLPVSLSQEQVWFLTQLAPDNLSYNAQAVLDFRGVLDVTALERTLTEIVRRHEIFCTTFPTVDGRPVQRIHAPWEVRLPVVDFSGVPEDRREGAARGWLHRHLRRRFDVARLPLVRWTLLRLSDREHRLVYVEHHFIHDGWSFGVFLRELTALYGAYTRGEPSPLPELPVQFADFAVWHRGVMRGERIRAQLAFWKEELAGADPVLELPTDRPRPPAIRFRGSALRTRIPPRVARAARGFTRRSGATLYMTLLAAFEALLQRYSDQEDFCLGGAVANRSWKETEPLIGMIVNTVAIRARLGEARSFRELVAQVKATTLEAYAHKDVHFGQVVEAVQPERSLSRLPIYQVAFGCHDSPYPDLTLPGLTIEPMEALNNGSAKFDLHVVVMPRAEMRPGAPEDEVHTVWEFSTDLFDEGTVERMIRHYHALLEAVLADPDAGFREVPLLDDAERRQLLEWGSGGAGGGGKGGLHERFAEQARRTPDTPAVVHGDSALSYADLDARADALAAELRARGLRPETPVGVCLERGIDVVAALLGVLRAGGVYLPLDPSYPEDRLAFMLADSGVRLVLTHERFRDRLPDFGGEVVLLDQAVPSPRTPAAPSFVDADNLAYVIYTSGSTGTPKGVMVSHGAAVNLLASALETFGARPGSRVVQTASLSFDASLLEILLVLLSGATLYVADRETVLSAEALGALLREREIELWVSTPALLEL
ncbi:MAG TPA: AMP-binding protein, partial [Longimicrobiaceae bacterium]|nr:AMP-binding protein [Longimicrobiaceae bacterium]